MVFDIQWPQSDISVHAQRLQCMVRKQVPARQPL